jgi:ACS family hexuronate transporter-like MFS transporter
MADPKNSTPVSTPAVPQRESSNPVAELGSIAGVAAGAIGRRRWTICAFLFFATTINYMDRQVIGILAPELQRIIGWNEIQYGHIITSFQFAYAIGLLVAGGIIDRVGTRIGYALAIGVWSVSALCHSLVSTVGGFEVVRFFLGLGESGNFPAALKAVAEWFPKKERSLAAGIFNSGSNIGAILAPLTVPWIALHLGWRWAFVFTAFFSATWLVAWLLFYKTPREHPAVTPAELAYIESDPAEPAGKVAWSRLLPYRQTWVFTLCKFITDPVWWFLLFWLPKFLNASHGLTLGKLGPPLVAIYVMADLGSIGGGWFSSALIRRGWPVYRARKTAMLVCALLVVPIVFAATASSLWVAVGLISLAAAAHQGFSANLLTFPSDMFPRRTVASVAGIGGFGGAIGGMGIATFTGYLLEWTHSYVPIFILAGTAYLVALLVIQILLPKLDPLMLDA